MKRLSPFLIISICLMAIVFMASTCNDKAKEAKETIDTMVTKTDEAFKNHRDSVPSKKQYSGPLFELSHDYPTTYTPVVDPTWQQSLNGQPYPEHQISIYNTEQMQHQNVPDQSCQPTQRAQEQNQESAQVVPGKVQTHLEAEL